MNVIKIGKDPFLNREIKKVIFKDKPVQQLFNEVDVITGHPSSNLAVAFVYTWSEDLPPKIIREFKQRISNYCYMVGYWRTTNGGRYVFSNILANPNVNKLFLIVFGKDNGHLLVDAVENFWKHGVDKKGFIKKSKAQNPRFEQLPIAALKRIREQCDLIVLRDVNPGDMSKIDWLLRKSLDSPEKGINVKDTELNIEYVSNVIKNNMLYDDGARFLKPMLIDLATRSKKLKYERKQLLGSIGQSVQAKNLDEAQQLLAAYIHKQGSCLTDMRNITTIECRSITITILDALEQIPKGFSKRYLEHYVDEFINGPPSSELVYTYHDRIFNRWGNQVERVLKLIKANGSNSRRMLISLWDPKTDMESPSPPCLILIWVVIRDKKLEFHVLFRSHHLATVTPDGMLMEGEGAFVPNIYALATLQQIIAKRVKIKRGPLVLTDFSGHLYSSDMGKD